MEIKMGETEGKNESEMAKISEGWQKKNNACSCLKGKS